MIALLLFLVMSNSPSATHEIRMYGDGPLAFSIDVPKSWGYSDKSFDVCHYRSVQVCANNRGDDSLRVVDWREDFPNGPARATYSYGPEAFEHQLDAGDVYLDLAVWDGPPQAERPYLWSRDRDPSVRIQEAARRRTPRWETEGIVVYRVGFVRWGYAWEALIAARKPFESRDVDEAFGILETLRFPDTPVCDPHQAVEVAIPSLPETMRPQPEWLEDCEFSLHYRVDADTSGQGFEVKFSVLDGTSDRRVVRSVGYFVDRTGELMPLKR